MKRLHGFRMIVTRSQSQAPGLSDLLRNEGAIVQEVPAIRIVENDQTVSELKNKLAQLSSYDWLLLTSVNSVQILQKIKVDWNAIKIACIGKATAEKVREFGGSVALVPPEFRAESLSEELRKENLQGARILLPRAEGSRPILPDELRQAGAIVEEIHIYEAKIEEESRKILEELLKSGEIDFLTFTSSSTVRNFAELAGALPWQRIPAACIGPITANTLREYGIEPAVEAIEFTMEGLVEALVKSMDRRL